MEPEDHSEHAKAAGGILLAWGAFLLALAGLSDPAIVGRYHFRTPLSGEALAETSKSRLVFGLSGVALLGAGTLLRRFARSHRLARGGLALLAGLSGVLPLLVLERGTRPFVERLTTLFEADAELGWRHRPAADDTYWGARVRTNVHGMRGPERALAKPAGRRLVVLGDSVVFGLLLEDDADTFPARLEHALAARTTGSFECLNTGVCGWSTRQERLFLERDGGRWQPDVVVLGFVLNDVTECGAGHVAVQLVASRPARLPAWIAESGIYLALRELALRRALAGDSPAALAHRSRLTPYHLILQPDSAPVQVAWEQVLPELEGILAWCQARTIPLVLVVFPFALQLREPTAVSPQTILADFARGRELPFLDLLPPLAAAQRARGLAQGALFLDGLHPTALGNELAAAELARFLVEGGLVP